MVDATRGASGRHHRQRQFRFGVGSGGFASLRISSRPADDAGHPGRLRPGGEDRQASTGEVRGEGASSSSGEAATRSGSGGGVPPYAGHSA